MAYAPTESGDPNQYKSPDSTLDGTAKKPRGCMFYGCIVLIVLSVLGLLATGATVYTAYYYYNKLVQEYTATTPMTLPPLAITDEDRKSIDDRWKTFHEAADRGEAAELEITANDINALISENPDLKGTVFVSIEGSEVGGKISFPLSKTGLPGLSGRFFNGNATFTVTLEDGYLEAHLKSVEVNGKTPPADFMTQLSNENLLKDAKFDDKTREKMRKIESLTVKDGKIILKSRVKKSDGETPKEEPKGEEPKKAETAPADAPKAETPAADAPKAEAPPADATKAEAPPADAPKAETPAADAPKAEAPAPEAPKTDAPAAEAPKAEAPKADAPAADAPKAEAPKAA